MGIEKKICKKCWFFSYPAPPIDEVRDGRAMNFTIYVPLTIEMINSKDGNI